MREINCHAIEGVPNTVRIETLDDAKPNDAHCRYQFLLKQGGTFQPFSQLTFQKGPLKETLPDGTVRDVLSNGITNEALLAVVIDRLESFQSGSFKCEENDRALRAIQKGLRCLHERTRERIRRNVEGFLKP